MLRARDNLAIFISLALLACCFIAGFLLVQGNSPLSVPPAPLTYSTEPMAATASSIPGLSARPLVIKKAIYGDLPDGVSVDVTSKVAEHAGKTDLSIDAVNDNFGDPGAGINKKLRVDYLANGLPHSRTVNEGETFKIHTQLGPARLVIKKAVYGDLPDGSAANVTEMVAARADNDSLSIAPTNDIFGDPASGIVKKLRVDYLFDGKEKSKTVGEGETMTISNSGE